MPWPTRFILALLVLRPVVGTAAASLGDGEQERAPLVIINTMPRTLTIASRVNPPAGDSTEHGEVGGQTTRIWDAALSAGARNEIVVILPPDRPLAGARTQVAARQVWVNNARPGERPPSTQIVVEWRDGLVLRELTGDEKMPLHPRQADLIVENNTDFGLIIQRTWKFHPLFPSTATEVVGRAGPMADSRLESALHIGRDVITITAVRAAGTPIASIERSVYVNDPGGNRSPAAQRLVVSDRDFGPFGILESSRTPSAGTCHLAGTWANTLNGRGQGTWTFSPLGDGRYQARESGFAGASGTATLSGNQVTLDFTFQGGRGTYTLTLSSDCARAEGTWRNTHPDSGTAIFVRQ